VLQRDSEPVQGPNIDDRELAALQSELLAMTPTQLARALAAKELGEVADEEKPNPK
jgi:hypothetical protein